MRSNMLKFLPVLALCLLGAQTQKFHFYGCPSIHTQKNFQWERFLGKWYEAQTYSHRYERHIKCVEQEFSAGANETLIKVSVKWRDERNRENKLVDSVIADPSGYFDSKLQLPLAPVWFNVRTNEYWVLGTDYENYAVVYSCPSLQDTFFFFSSENLWILTRDRNPSEEVLQNALEVFDRNDYLEREFLTSSNQTGC